MQKKFLALSMLGLLSAGMLAGCGPNNNDVEICNNNADDDGDGDRDCDDSDCAADPACLNRELDGGACANDDGCESDSCLTETEFGFPAGYCTTACQVDEDCVNSEEGDALCVNFNGGTCFDACEADTDCRDGYTCLDIGAPVSICVFACTEDAQCGESDRCNVDTGLCESDEICNDQIDNDRDGPADCSDVDCLVDPTCADAINEACGSAVNLNAGTLSDDTEGGTSGLSGACQLAVGGDGLGLEDVFTFAPGAAGDLTLTLTSDADLGVYVRNVCEDGGSEIACADVAFGPGGVETLTVGIGTDPVTVVVDGFTIAEVGPYTLDVVFVPLACGDGVVALAEGCDDGNVTAGDGCDADCAVEDGFLCDGSPSVCVNVQAVCDAAVVAVIGDNAGDTTGGSNIASGSCQLAQLGSDGLGLEDIFSVTAAATGEFTFTLTSDADLGVYAQSDCGDAASEIGCIDNDFGAGAVETLVLGVTAGQSFSLFVDGFNAAEAGPYTLNVAFNEAICGDGVVALAEGCDDGNTVAGDGCDAVCAVEAGFTCVGEPSVCSAVAGFCNAAVVAVIGDNAGDNTGGSNIATGSCQLAFGADGLGLEDIFTFTPAVDGDITFTLTAATDMGVYAQATCGDAASEIGCADNFFAGGIEILTIPGVAGTPITVFVDGFNAGEEGPYTLNIAQ